MIINQERILLIGGNNKDTVFEDAYILEINENRNEIRWTQLGQLCENTPNIPYAKFSLALIREKVYLFGGLRKNGKICEISSDIYTLKVENLPRLAFVREVPQFG